MKNLVAVLLVFFTGISAQASELDVFVGKYAIKNCSFDGVRAYASVGTSDIGNDEINIQMYGEDSDLVSLILGYEEAENPNYQHGSPIKTVITRGYFQGATLVNKQVYVKGDGSQNLASISILTKTANGLSFKEINGSGEVQFFCEYVKN